MRKMFSTLLLGLFFFSSRACHCSVSAYPFSFACRVFYLFFSSLTPLLPVSVSESWKIWQHPQFLFCLFFSFSLEKFLKHPHNGRGFTCFISTTKFRRVWKRTLLHSPPPLVIYLFISKWKSVKEKESLMLVCTAFRRVSFSSNYLF